VVETVMIANPFDWPNPPKCPHPRCRDIRLLVVRLRVDELTEFDRITAAASLLDLIDARHALNAEEDH
jgi:hypothetical protein